MFDLGQCKHLKIHVYEQNVYWYMYMIEMLIAMNCTCHLHANTFQGQVQMSVMGITPFSKKKQKQKKL